MSTGWVHSWDLSTGVDGPGTRLVVFLSGCPLRCLYCQNPDTWCKHDGTRTDAAHIRNLMRHYRPFVTVAGGGVTLSGGEPLQQPEYARELLQTAKRLGLHTALDTSGFLGRKADDALLAATDLVLLDIKAGTDTTHRRLTRRPLAPTLAFAERLAALAKPVWVRYVLVPGITDDPGEVDAVAGVAARLGNVERIDVLPFHKLGAPKYERLRIPFPLAHVPTPTAPATEAARERFRAHGLAA
jgi:pyruvate formate lyase activating enzyme